MTHTNLFVRISLFFTVFIISFLSHANISYGQLGGCQQSTYQPLTFQEECEPIATCVASSRCSFTTGTPTGPYSCEMEKMASYRTVTTSCNASGQVVRSESACSTVKAYSCGTSITQTGCASNSDCPQPPYTSCSTYCDLSEPIGGRGACRQVDPLCSAFGNGGFYCGDGYCSAGESNSNCSADCPVSQQPANFVITAAPTSRVITKGGSTSYTITANPVNGFTSTVLLDAVCPTGATCSITANIIRDPEEPSKVDLSYGAQDATLSVSGTSNIALGDFSINVSGIGGGATHRVYPQLSVIPSRPSSMTAAVSGSCPSTGIALSWTASSGADSYKLYRSTTNSQPSTPYKIVGNVTSDSDFPTKGYTYYYWVEALHSPSGNYSDSRASNAVNFPTCPPTSTPNLTAGEVNQTTTATQGTPISFTSTISNIGNASTGASFSNFFQLSTSADGVANPVDISANSTMSALAASGAGTATSNSYTFSSAGTYYIRACADKSDRNSSGVIAESDESDNCGSWTTVNVGTPAPIAITSFTPYYTTITNYPTINNNSVYWTTSGNPTSCVASGSSPWGNGSGTAAVNASISSGNQYQGVYPSTGTYTYTLTCSKAGVPNATATFSVVVSSSVSQFRLNVTKPIGGTIRTVTGGTNTPDGLISCGTTCSRQYNQGSSVTLQAVPDTSYWRFVGWGDACSGQGTGNCTLTINGNATVTAQFRPKSLLYQEF